MLAWGDLVCKLVLHDRIVESRYPYTRNICLGCSLFVQLCVPALLLNAYDGLTLVLKTI